MRIIKTLQRLLNSSLVEIHSARKKTVFWAVLALITGSRLSLTGLGRAAKGSALTKHNIKRVDRLLKNKYLFQETRIFYRAIAKLLIGSKKRPAIIVDWTGIGTKHTALVAAVPVDGRAIPILIGVHSYKLNNNGTVEKRFLRKLKRVIPSGCNPIIITDAGFRNAWFREVKDMGWDFVGRVLSTVHTRPVEGWKWKSLQSLFSKATYSAKSLGCFWMAKSNPLKVKLAIIKKKVTRRKSKKIGEKSAVEARKRSLKPVS